ncbi:phage tail assembly chaperone [uncultured Sphingomonas sp.]|uniref:phage tail assembly chaperone n=1 Tax=uncultured Sphingomonas sp. TaxID=158754 RepID=UPI0025DC635F|nr:phage tail assembly chaperone [uncultured Sphingomonas sp.]
MRGLKSSPEWGGGPSAAWWRGGSASKSPVEPPLHQPSAGPPPRTGEDFQRTASRLAGRICAAVGWAPDTFWSATPAEVAALFVDPAAAVPTMTSADLTTLMEAHPDG